VLLGLGQERLDWVFKNRGQFFSLPSVYELPSPLEPLDAIAGSAGTLHPRVGGMAVRADVGDDLATRRTGRERIAARRTADRRQDKLRLKLLQGNRLLRGTGRRHSACKPPYNRKRSQATGYSRSKGSDPLSHWD
jgi:hypothetical protein